MYRSLSLSLSIDLSLRCVQRVLEILRELAFGLFRRSIRRSAAAYAQRNAVRAVRERERESTHVLRGHDQPSSDFRSPPAARVRSYHILECTAHAIDRPIDRSMIGLSAVRLQRLDSRECRERKRAVSPLYCCCCCLYCAAACLSDRKLRFRLLTRPISGASARSPW